MAMPEADHLFAKFRRTRDPECLGQVFDLLAPRLLLVAERLVRSRTLAEDLVQATFVSAIEAVGAFDGQRPVLPWLCGILANHGGMARRKAGRAPDCEPLTEGVERSAAQAEPPDAAQLAELAARVGGAVDALPEQQRTVLLLRLFHGLRPLEIARVLGRSPETVRTWLHRGLTELRRTLRGGTLPAALLREEGRGLPAVRAALLSQAGSLAPVVALSITGGVVLMKKVLVVGVVAIGLLGAGAGVWTAWPQPQAPAVLEGAGVAAPVYGSSSHATVVTTDDPAAPASRQAATAPAAVTPQRAVVRGRCVGATDRSPLAHCEVRLRCWPEPAAERAAADPEWLGPVRTGGDGAFTFTVPCTQALLPELILRGDGLVAREGALSSIPSQGGLVRVQPGSELDLGDIPLRPGARVTGRVVDTAGVPQGKVMLLLKSDRQRPVPGFSLKLFETSWAQDVSAADGSFAFQPLLPPGGYLIEVSGRQPVGRIEVEIPADARLEPLTITLRRPEEIETITGVVVDDTGRPVAGARIDAVARMPGSGGQSSTAAADGSFRLERGLKDAFAQTQLRVWNEDLEPFQSEASYAWGANDVRLVVTRCLTVELRVTDGRTGKPVEGFGVVIQFALGQPGSSFQSHAFAPRQGRHPGGKLALRGLRRGDNLIWIEPGSGLGLSGTQHRLHVGPETRGHEIQLFPPAACTLQVVRPDRTPVVGTVVELLRPLGRTPLDAGAFVFDLPARVSSSQEHQAVRLLRDTTDTEGRLVLSAPAGEPLVLRLLGPGHVPILHLDATFAPGASERTVQVAPGARVVGRVRPVAAIRQFDPSADTIAQNSVLGPLHPYFREYFPGLQLVHATRPGDQLPPNRDRWLVDADGCFVLDGVPPGDWSLRLAYRTHSMGSSQELAGLANLTVGETRTLELDLAWLVHARLAGVVMRDGHVITGVNVMPRGFRLDARGDRVSIPTASQVADGDGRFALSLPAGSYRLHVAVKGPDRSRALVPCREVVELTAGTTREQVFHLDVAALHLRVVHADGVTPAMGVSLNLVVPELDWNWQTAPSDAQGEIHVPAVAPGSIRVRVAPRLVPVVTARTFQDLVTIEAVPGTAPRRETIVLPAGY